MTDNKVIAQFQETPYYAWVASSMSPRELKTWDKQLADGGEEIDRHLQLGEKSTAIAVQLKITNWQDDPESLERVVNQTFAETDGESEDPGIEVSFG